MDPHEGGVVFFGGLRLLGTRQLTIVVGVRRPHRMLTDEPKPDLALPSRTSS